jgi:nitrogen fixation/metabolism regulation signal transduction histidine kinase
MSGWRRSLAGQFALRVLPLLAVGIAVALALQAWLGDALLAGLLAVGASGLVLLWLLGAWMSPVRSLIRALTGTALSYRDGDYSFGLRWPRNDELGDLVAGHNAIGEALRDKQLQLVQRELLLDTMVQNTPVAMLLLDTQQHVVFANVAARKLVSEGRRLDGHALHTLLAGREDALSEALRHGTAGVFSTGDGEDDDVYHLATSAFRLNGRAHTLLLVRQITTELRRQEVQTWKKVIRVISHELNNSLAPMASLAHSGAELARRGQVEKLPTVFATIEERARHLDGFLRDYARFAKLPQPRIEAHDPIALVERLQSQIPFEVDGSIPQEPLRADGAQLEQALLNLLKNAHEASPPEAEVGLRLRHVNGDWRIDVLDRGTGMSEAVMANALVPFYSTKRSGTGLGLALVREIIEAHGGRIGLANREGGGLCVSLVLPG